MSSPTPVRRPFRLRGRTRKAFLVVHIIAAAMWFGIDLAFGILALTALLTDSAQTAGTALQAIELFAVWPMFGAGLVCLGTGVVLGLGSRYGLLRYWWVAVKLGINVALCTLILFALRPGIDDAASIGRRLVAGDPAAAVPADLIFPVLGRVSRISVGPRRPARTLAALSIVGAALPQPSAGRCPQRSPHSALRSHAPDAAA